MKAICKPHAGLRPEISELATASLLPSYIGSPWLRSTYENPARGIDIIGVSAFEIPDFRYPGKRPDTKPISETRFLTHDEWIGRNRTRSRHPNAFGLKEITDCFDAIFASDAGMLHAAKWHHVANRTIGIDPHCPRFESLRHTNGAGGGPLPYSFLQTPNKTLFFFPPPARPSLL